MGKGLDAEGAIRIHLITPSKNCVKECINKIGFSFLEA
jgi:hypothetical protein